MTGRARGAGPSAPSRHRAAPEPRAGRSPRGPRRPPAATPKPTAKPTPRPTRTPRPTLPTTFGVEDPSDGARTAGTVILVRGHAPPRSTVTRDVQLWFDQHTVADADGHWSMEVPLSAGENRLTFRLGDDRSTVETITVNSDPSRGGNVSGG